MLLFRMITNPDLSPPNAAEPTIRGWKHSLGTAGDLREEFRWHPLEFIDQWLSTCQGRNAYRTMRLRSPSAGGRILLGPFLIDIDNQDWTNGYGEDLEAALDVARQSLNLLRRRGLVSGDDFRVFFSGRKGFNIEVAPTSLGINGEEAGQITASALILEEITAGLSLGATTVDRIYGDRFEYRLKHPYIRLHESSNCWRTLSDYFCRRRIELSDGDVNTLTATQIVKQSDFN